VTPTNPTPNNLAARKEAMNEEWPEEVRAAKTLIADYEEAMAKLASYQEVEKLESFNCLHFYTKGLAGPKDGYVDAREIEVWFFNWESKKRGKSMRLHDSIKFEGVTVALVMAYVDGSSYIVFSHLCKADTNFQQLRVAKFEVNHE
jgi:hypothetical protein